MSFVVVDTSIVLPGLIGKPGEMEKPECVRARAFFDWMAKNSIQAAIAAPTLAELMLHRTGPTRGRSMERDLSPAPLHPVVGPVLGAEIATPHTAIRWRAWATDPPSHNGYFLIIRLSKFDRGEDTLWAEEAQRWEDGPGAKPGMYVSDGDGDSPIDETEILYWCDLPAVPNPLFKANP